MQATLTKPPSAERQSAWAWRRFRRHRAVLIGFSLLSLLLSAVLAPWSPYNMRSQNLSAMLEPPSLTHPFGTDELGRDLLARLVWGGRISLSIGFLLPGCGLPRHGSWRTGRFAGRLSRPRAHALC